MYAIAGNSPMTVDIIERRKVVGWDVASHDKMSVSPGVQFKTEHIGVPYLCLLDLKSIILPYTLRCQ